MSRLFLLRFSIISIKNMLSSKLNIVLNFSIFIIVFAITASSISILFEDRIEILEANITKNEINHIIYTKWLNRTPKIIYQIDSVYQNRNNDKLFSEIVTSLPDDDDKGSSTIYSSREEYYGYYFFINDFLLINFKNIDLALTDAVLISNNEEDIKLIKSKRLFFNNLINDYDYNRLKRFEYEDTKINIETNKFEDLMNYYSGFSIFVEKNLEILQKQKNFFLDFSTKYFSNKRNSYNADNSENLIEISQLAKLETNFIFFAFVIQFIIFVILQIFEVTFEREKINAKK